MSRTPIAYCEKCGGWLAVWDDAGNIVHIDDKGNYIYKPHRAKVSEILGVPVIDE